MRRSEKNLRFSMDSATASAASLHQANAAAPLPGVPAVAEPGREDVEDDPFHLGWREVRETAPDGSERVRRVPLTYRDLLDPQEGDFIAESTIHRDVTEQLAQILKDRYEDDPGAAVWRNLKIAFVIPGLTTGPGPDLCVVQGVVDRDRPRQSFRYGEEPGTVRLVVEVVSESSLKKDYEDILEIYAPLGVEEYVAIRPIGPYADGPFELRGWRLDKTSKQLRAVDPDPQGRLHLETTGVLLGTGPQGRDLALWDAATGERLLTPQEARRRAEAEVERLRAQLRDRTGE